MKYIFWGLICIPLFLNSTYGDEVGSTTYVQYKKGDPIILHLNYYGGINEWDAGASIDKELLILTNAMFITVTNSKSESVKPIKDKILSVWADTYFREPFNLVIDISKYYNLSQPDKYTVQWGCTDVKEDSVSIEIIDR